jgi:hypothetical protein
MEGGLFVSWSHRNFCCSSCYWCRNESKALLIVNNCWDCILAAVVLAILHDGW